MEPSKNFSTAASEIPDGKGQLDFEKPIRDLEFRISKLLELQNDSGIDHAQEIHKLRRELVKTTTRIYENLSAWETVQVARHPRRPLLHDYLDLMVHDFCPLHGDRRFGDDHAIVTGFGRIEREKVMIIGHNKGRNTMERVACNFGCALPEGYRKALLKMKLAEKFHLPVVCLIDTPGAYAGIGAEERGQPQAIAQNLIEMSRLRVPLVCVIIGEGGSGGALGLGVGDRIAVMQYAYYSVISPEGCAAILWKDGQKAPAAAEALKLTSGDLLKLGVIDAVIPEPPGGAHRNPREAAHNLADYIIQSIRELRRYKIENLIDNRYQKFRKMGRVNPPGKLIKMK